METVQETIIKEINIYNEAQDCINESAENIGKLARKLLKELQKIDDWECMITACYSHYSKNKDIFFNWCSVTHTNDAIQFIKGYSDGFEYEVLEIKLNESLEQQVKNRLDELKSKKEKEEQNIKNKELEELRRLKEKYESKFNSKLYL